MKVENCEIKDEYVSCTKETPISEVARLMVNRHVDSVIVTENNRPVGVISVYDIVTRVVANGRDVNVTKAGDVMTTPIEVAKIDEDLIGVAKKMTSKRLFAIPVVNKVGELLGVVSLRDVLKTITGKEHV